MRFSSAWLFYIILQFVSRSTSRRPGRWDNNRPTQRSGRAAAPSCELVYLSALPISQFCRLLLGIFSFRALLSVTASAKVPVGLDVLKGKVNQRHSKGTFFLEEYSSCQSLHLPYCLVETNVTVVSSKRKAHTLLFNWQCRIFITYLPLLWYLSSHNVFLWNVSANLEPLPRLSLSPTEGACWWLPRCRTGLAAAASGMC